MVVLEIDGYISERGKGKPAPHFVRKKFIDSSGNEKNENSNNGISVQQNVSFCSPQTIEKARKDIEKENIDLEDIQKKTPLLNHYDTPQEEISFFRKELDNK